MSHPAPSVRTVCFWHRQIYEPWGKLRLNHFPPTISDCKDLATCQDRAHRKAGHGTSEMHRSRHPYIRSSGYHIQQQFDHLAVCLLFADETRNVYVAPGKTAPPDLSPHNGSLQFSSLRCGGHDFHTYHRDCTATSVPTDMRQSEWYVAPSYVHAIVDVNSFKACMRSNS